MNRKTEEEKKLVRKQWLEANKEKIREQERIYKENNKERLDEKRKEWDEKNKEHRLKYSNSDEQKNYRKEYKIKNKERDKEKRKLYNRLYNKKRKENDPMYKLITGLRSRITNILKSNGYTKKTKTLEILGCSFDEFKTHLESQFEPWMTWENRGLYNGTLNYGWDIDHIIPLSSATTEEELLKLCHFNNLQPLCSKINRDVKKHN